MISPYIKNIREKIGHELLLLPSVTILCFDENNRVLLAKHSNNQVWVAPGGMIEPDETLTDAANPGSAKTAPILCYSVAM